MSHRLSLSPLNHAALHRAVQEGARRAGEGLAEMIGRPVIATVRNVDLVPLGQVISRVGGADAPVTAIYVGIHDGIDGHLILVLAFDAAKGLADLVLEQPAGTTEVLGEMEQSALQEAGNIAGSFFLSALADTTGLTIQPTPPVLAQDMCGAILDGPLSLLAMDGDEALLIEAEFRQDERHIEGLLLMLPDQASLTTLLRRLA